MLASLASTTACYLAAVEATSMTPFLPIIPRACCLPWQCRQLGYCPYMHASSNAAAHTITSVLPMRLCSEALNMLPRSCGHPRSSRGTHHLHLYTCTLQQGRCKA
jgi:hypothetical protein